MVSRPSADGNNVENANSSAFPPHLNSKYSVLLWTEICVNHSLGHYNIQTFSIIFVLLHFLKIILLLWIATFKWLKMLYGTANVKNNTFKLKWWLFFNKILIVQNVQMLLGCSVSLPWTDSNMSYWLGNGCDMCMCSHLFCQLTSASFPLFLFTHVVTTRSWTYGSAQPRAVLK